MRNHSLIIWLLFFVYGVFAAVEVSVMEGDSVTLNPNDIATQSAAKLQWKVQGENTFIATIDRETPKKSVDGNEEKRFSGRLDVNSTTGSLTIKNLNTIDSRVYELQMKIGRETKSNIFNVTVRNVGESVSPMEGDSVTLHTGVKINSHNQILWKFQDQVITIAPLNGSDRRDFELNDQTGELTIRNIQIKQSGVYKMEINTSIINLHRKFSINISVEMNTELVKEGEPVTLRTGLIEVKGYDLTWKSKDHLMAEKNEKTNRFSKCNPDDRFKGRLDLNENTGSLTIRDTRTTDSGDYHLNMNSDSYSLQRTISVTVSGAASGICGAGVGLVVWAVTVFLL